MCANFNPASNSFLNNSSGTVSITGKTLSSVTTFCGSQAVLGSSLQCTDTGNYSDGSTLDITKFCSNSSDSSDLQSGSIPGAFNVGSVSGSPSHVSSTCFGIGGSTATVTALCGSAPTKPCGIQAFRAAGFKSDGTPFAILGEAFFNGKDTLTSGNMTLNSGSIVLSGAALSPSPFTADANNSITFTVTVQGGGPSTVFKTSPFVANGSNTVFVANPAGDIQASGELVPETTEPPFSGSGSWALYVGGQDASLGRWCVIFSSPISSSGVINSGTGPNATAKSNIKGTVSNPTLPPTVTGTFSPPDPTTGRFIASLQIGSSWQNNFDGIEVGSGTTAQLWLLSKDVASSTTPATVGTAIPQNPLLSGSFNLTNSLSCPSSTGGCVLSFYGGGTAPVAEVDQIVASPTPGLFSVTTSRNAGGTFSTSTGTNTGLMNAGGNGGVGGTAFMAIDANTGFAMTLDSNVGAGFYVAGSTTLPSGTLLAGVGTPKSFGVSVFAGEITLAGGGTTANSTNPTSFNVSTSSGGALTVQSGVTPTVNFSLNPSSNLVTATGLVAVTPVVGYPVQGNGFVGVSQSSAVNNCMTTMLFPYITSQNAASFDTFR
jgi:hypothetical protein